MNQTPSRHRILTASIASLFAVCGSASAQQTWVGSTSSDWNLPANWSGNALPGGNATINLTGSPTGPAPFTATISANLAATPVDIFVGTGAGASGRLDHTAGTAGTGDTNWMFVGVSGGTGIYNLANTATTGGTLTGFGTGSGSMAVGGTSTTGGRLYIGGRDTAGSAGIGTVNVNTTGTLSTGNDLFVGVNGGTGTFNLDAGTVNRTSGWTAIGNDTGGNGTFRMSGGTVTAAGTTIVGRNGGTGVLQISGGIYNVGGELQGGNDGGNNTASNATITVSNSGTLNVNSWLAVGRSAATGTLTISGNAVVNQGITDAGSALELTNANVGGNATVNLDGGSLTITRAVHGGGATGSSTFNFNGGILKPQAANATFLQGLTNAFVKVGGVRIDTQTFDITIAQALLTDAVSLGGGLTKTGSGTLTLTGANNYTGATTISNGTLSLGTIANGGAASSLGASTSAAANLVLDGGNLQYTGATASTDRAFTVSAGVTGTIDISDAATDLTISGGSAATNGNLVKTGLGALSLTGASLRTGTTTVNAGILGMTGNLAGPVVINGGLLNAVRQAVGALTVPSLTFGASGGVNFDFGVGTNDIITILNAGGLALGTGNSINLFQAGGTTPFTTNGTYTLLDYTTSFTGSLNGAFIVTNSQPGKIYSIANNLGATSLDLTIGDAVTATWNVDGGGSWNVAGNWTGGVPNSVGATANFGAILTAPNAPATVTVDGAKTVGNIVFSNANTYNVTAGSGGVLTLDNGLGTATLSATVGSHSINAPIVMVNPSALSADAAATLTIGGNISGGAGLSKIGAGTVILTGANSYTTTTVATGTLQIGAAGASGSLGAGAATIAGGATLDFKSSNAMTIANDIKGAGAFAQSGSGTTTYTGNDTHSGPVNVTGGSLINQGTINGPSTVSVTGGSFINEGTITSVSALSVSGGSSTLRAASNTTVNGAIDVGTSAVGPSALTVNTTGALNVTGNVTAGAGAGNNGSLTVTNGTINQTGGTGIIIGNNGGTGSYTQTGGIVNTGTAGQGLQLGVGTNGSNATANISGGALNIPNEFWISNGAAGNTASLTMSAGAISAGGWFVVGRTGATGSLNLSGGTVTKGGAADTYFIVGSLAGTGTVTQTGGALNVTAGGIRLGENNGTTPALNTLWDMQGGTSTVGGEINVGWSSSQATWNVSGSSVVTATGRLIVGGVTANTGANGGVVVGGNPVGTVNISGTSSVTFSGSDSRIGGDNSAASAGAQGTVNVSGGTLSFGGNLQVGAYGQGTMNVSGTGAVTSSTFATVGRFAGGVGTLNVNGGSYTQTGQFLMIGEEGTGTLNLNSGLVDVTNLRVGHTATGNGTVNLNGGTLTTDFVQKTAAGSTAAFKFNGGLLRAKSANTDFFLGLPASSITVENGGAKFDTNGNAITITQGLAPGAGSTGGFTKLGAGTLTLTGASTFTGPTIVDAGTLALTGSLNTSSKVTVNSGATFDVSGVGGGYTVPSGQTVGGSGTVDGAVALGGGAKLAPGNSPGTLTFNSTLNLTLAAATVASSSLVFELGTFANSDKVLLTSGTLSIGTGVLAFDDFSFTALTGFGPGDYTLFDSSLAIVGSLDVPANLTGTVGGLSATVQLANGNTDVVLHVVPEPGALTSLLGGVGMLLGLRRRRQNF